MSQRKLLEYFLENVCTLLIEQNPVHRTIIFKPKVDSWLTESDVYFTSKDQSITIGIHGRQRFPFNQHATLSRVTRILRGCYVSVCLHILFGGGLFIILRFGWSSVCWLNHEIRVLVERSVSKSGGLVYSRNRYKVESVFDLEHTDTLKSVVITVYHVDTYQECSHTSNPTSGHT